MTDHRVHTLAAAAGVSGVAGTLCYVAAIFLPMGERVAYAVVMAWPVLSIVFAYGLFRLLEAERESAANRLAFLFACLAFATLAAMISVQMAVRMGIAEEAAAAPPGDKGLYDPLLAALRLVDYGLDVAWDVLIGTCLAFLGAAIGGDRRFGRGWGWPASLLGAGLVILNLITFPHPPADAGLFDLGPFIGLFIIALSARLAAVGLAGRRAGRPSSAG